MASDKSLVLRLGNLVGMGQRDLDGDDAVAQNRPGSITIGMDAYGSQRVFRYIKNKQGGSVTKGYVGRRPANTAVTNMSSSSTTKQIVTSGLTANAHDGKMIYIVGETGGTAPDGEVSIINSNTATLINLDSQYPLSTTPSTGSADAIIVSNWQFAAAGAGVLASYVHGAIIGQDGITNNQFGWVQAEGPCVVNQTTSAITVDTPIETSATAGQVVGVSGGHEIWIGDALVTSQANATKCLVWLRCFSRETTGGTP